MSDSIKDYLNSIARFPLLTPQQEIQLARRISRMRELKAATHELTTAERREIRSGEKARNQFMQSNLQLVVHVAKKYERSRRKSLEIMDLIQEGNIGLARAVELFDHTRGYKFSTYAYWWIKQGIHRALSQSDDMIRIPTGMHELLYKINRVNQTLSHQFCRAPTPEELATEVGITVAALHTAIRQCTKVVSFDVLVHEDGGSLLDIIADPNTAEINERIEMSFQTQEMMKLFHEYLDERTQFVIQSRLLDKPMPWGEMARQTGVSPTRLQQIERRGVLRLRALLRNPLDNTPLGNLQCPQSS
jgi:RNA polymerase primary sigma factor